MSKESRRMAGLLLIILPTVLYGGVSLLRLLTDPGSGYAENPLRQDLFRAGHAHAGVLLVLSLITLRYVDETSLSDGWKQFVRSSIPTSAIFLPAAFSSRFFHRMRQSRMLSSIWLMSERCCLGPD